MNVREHLANKLPVYLLVVVLGALMSFYYFVFVPQNEQRLNEHADRLLDNKAKSVIEKYKGYNNAIATSQKAYFLKWYFKIHPDETGVYVKEKYDTLYFSQRAATNYILVTKKDFKKALVDDKLKPETHGDTITNIYQAKSGNYHFVFEPTWEFLNSDRKDKKSVHPYLWLHVPEFMANLKANDFFDDLFLVSVPEPKSSTDTKIKITDLDGAVLDNSKLGLVSFNVPDSVKKFGTGYFSKKFSGQVFKVYIKKIKLKRGLEVYLVGMVPQSELHSQAREVPIWFVVFCLMASLMLIFLFPVLKIFSVNNHERLSAQDARLSIFSMILCLSLTTILLVGSYIFWGLDSTRMDSELCQLSTSIADSTKIQVDSLQKVLSDPFLFSKATAQENLKELQAKHSSVKKFNEVFSLRLNRNEKTKTEEGSAEKLFASEGENEFDLKTFPTQVSSREYFSVIKAAKQNGQPIDYHLQSINSFTSGRSEAAVSILWQDTLVRVITSRLPSIINPILPTPFKFVVISKKGEVKFHSDWRELQYENFISECNDDPTLAAHLQNNVIDFINFSYLRNECRAFCRPLMKDWHLIVYYELHETRNLAAEIFTLCLLSMGLVLLCNGLVHGCLMLDRERSGLLKTKTFFYHWLSPQRTRARHWLHLFALGIMLFAIELIWMFGFHSITASIFIVFFITTAFYLVCYSELNKKRIAPKPSRSVKWLSILTAIWLVAFLIASWKACHAENFFYIGVVILLLLAWMKWRRKIKWSKWASKAGQYFAYRLFLLSTLLVLAVGPAWIFISEHYYYSSLASNYSKTFENVKKVQSKSVGDKQNFRGIDYTNQALSDTSSWVSFDAKNPDIAFYRFLQGFQIETKSLSGFKYEFLPNQAPYALSLKPEKRPTVLKVEAPLSTLINPDEKGNQLTRETKINKLEWLPPSLEVASFILIALLVFFFILWWIIREMPRKIFFSPDKIAWDCYPKRKVETFLEREFENDTENRHPLHAVSGPDKERLRDDYKRALRKAIKNKSVARLIRDKYILKLQHLAKKEYGTAWSNCTEEEKYLLYDLSTDGVTNLTDQILIGRLAEKGLLRLTPRLEPVNLSFANFVLNSMNEKTLAEWRTKEDREGNWSNLRLILIIIIVAAFVFLSVAEEGFAGRVTALLASLGLIFPRIIGLLTSMGDLLKKKPS